MVGNTIESGANAPVPSLVKVSRVPFQVNEPGPAYAVTAAVTAALSVPRSALSVSMLARPRLTNAVSPTRSVSESSTTKVTLFPSITVGGPVIENVAVWTSRTTEMMLLARLPSTSPSLTLTWKTRSVSVGKGESFR